MIKGKNVKVKGKFENSDYCISVGVWGRKPSKEIMNTGKFPRVTVVFPICQNLS